MTVEALRRGEPEVLAELLERYGREIQGVAFLILRDQAEAEDVLMETLLTALERGSTLRDPKALRAWLMRMAANQALMKHRRGRRIRFLAMVPDTAAPSDDAAGRLDLLNSLAALPLRSRAAVVLHYYADLPVADVAAAMGTSPNTVKTQLRTALATLRKSMRDPVAAPISGEVARG